MFEDAETGLTLVGGLVRRDGEVRKREHAINEGRGVALLIGGVVVTETVFAIPGLGSLTVDVVLNRDFPVIQGLVLFFAVSYVVINLLVDLSYLVLDPRIRY